MSRPACQVHLLTRYVTEYLDHLGTWLSSSPLCQVQPPHPLLQVLVGRRVVSVGRGGLARTHFPRVGDFTLLLEEAGGDGGTGEELVTGYTWVVDCTGTLGYPRWLGAGGPVPGERGLGDRVCHRVPDMVGYPARWRGRTMVVGSGASAATVLHQLRALGGAGEVPAHSSPQRWCG